MRTLFASILVAAALIAALIGWYEAGWSGVEASETELRARPLRDAETQARELASDVVGRLEQLRKSETARGYYEYQNLYHDPRTTSEGVTVMPSPLVSGPGDPLIRAHFQIKQGAGGGWQVSMPTINDDIPELSNKALLAADTELRTRLVAVADRIADASAGPPLQLPTLVAAADPPKKPHVRSNRPVSDGTATASTEPPTAGATGSGTGSGSGSGPDKSSDPVAQNDSVEQTQVLQLSPDQYAQNAFSNNAYNVARTNAREIDPQELYTQQAQQPKPQQQRRNPPQQQTPQQTPPQQMMTPPNQAANPPPQAQVQTQTPTQVPPQTANATNEHPQPATTADTTPTPPTTTTNTTTTTTTTTTAPRPVHHRRRTPATPPPPPPPITIAIAPLEWHELTIGGRDSLVALRRVDTPDGTLTQGILIDQDSVAAYIEDRMPGARLATDAEPHAAFAPLPIGTWKVGVPLDLGAIDASVAAVKSAFWGRFIPVSALAALCGMMVIVVVARTERLARARSRFAAAAAHELRTPLAGLQLYGDMLSDGLGDPGKQKQYAHRISEEASRLGRVVANVLGFSQLERGDLSINVRTADAAAAARDVIERVRPTFERAGVELEVDLADDLEARFDPDAMARILGNLLDNAEKYSRGPDSRKIELVGRRVGDKVELAVSDSGPGVAPGARLFVPFSRGVGSDGPAGLGLGLILSRSLARAMGGDLAHTGGARFVLSLAASGSPPTDADPA